MRILSIDPGYGRCGMAVVEGESGKEELLFSQCFETDSEKSFFERLRVIGEEIENLIKEHNPDAVAIEKLFFNSNQKTAMKVSQVRGMIAYIALSHERELFEYTPLQIKNAVTGYGKSSKQQVIDMTEQLISIGKDIKHDDEYDAIAVGITCIASENSLLSDA